MIAAAETSSRGPRLSRSSISRVVVLISFSALLGFFFQGRVIKSSAFIPEASQQEDKLKDPQSIAEGAKLFAPVCGNAYCHGTGGRGGGAPKLRGRGLEPAYLFKTISSGIPGTAMLGFKSEFSDEQIWKVVAFVISDQAVNTVSSSDVPAGAKSSPSPSPSVSEPTSSMVGSIQAGRALFFDSSQPKSCHSCHWLRGEGTPIGPDLSRLADKPPRELLLGIILAREVKDSRFAPVTISLRNGDRIVGVKKDEDNDSIRLYDTTELPAVLRTIQKADIVKTEVSNESIMPKDYASVYTMKQLLDLVTFLKASQSSITLKDLFQ